MPTTGSRRSQDGTIERPATSAADHLPPFPEGWYLVTTRQTLLREKLIEKTWMGEEIVAWCDEEGRICVADSICPHLGSSLGPEVGGKVRGGRLVCPFHGFEFDTTGHCDAVRSGRKGRQTADLRNQRNLRHGLRLVRERRPPFALGSSG